MKKKLGKINTKLNNFAFLQLRNRNHWDWIVKSPIYQCQLEADICKEICHQNGLLYLDRNNNKKLNIKTPRASQMHPDQKAISQKPMHKKADQKLQRGLKRRFRVTVFLSLHLTGQSVWELERAPDIRAVFRALHPQSCSAWLRQSRRSMEKQGTKGKYWCLPQLGKPFPFSSMSQ